MTDVLSWLAALLQAPLFAAWLLLVLYLLFLTVSALAARLGQKQASLGIEPRTRFSILVPAHNESVVIAECLKSLTSFSYPADKRQVIVIADNCTDDTAAIAKAAGATVYERSNDEQRGKGYALDWAMRRLLGEDEGWTDAILVFDADTLASPHYLSLMDARLQAGSLALQGPYNLLNPFDNWRTALLYSALILHNRLRPLARSAWGWTTLLKGNGMCFARGVIERFGWNRYGLAEDIEYTTMLLDAGIKVEYVREAELYAQAPQTSKQANSQRMRWEGGRLAVARRDGLRMLASALRLRSATKLDWAMDLLTPPMGILIGLPVLMLAVNAPLALIWGGAFTFMGWAWLALLIGGATYVVGGLLISGADRRAYLYLLATPIFLLWKLRIYAAMLLGRGPRGWVRTERTTMS